MDEWMNGWMGGWVDEWMSVSEKVVLNRVPFLFFSSLLYENMNNGVLNIFGFRLATHASLVDFRRHVRDEFELACNRLIKPSHSNSGWIGRVSKRGNTDVDQFSRFQSHAND